MEDIALCEREFDLLLETVFDSDDVSATAPTPSDAAQTSERARPDARQDDVPSTQTLCLFDALAPLVTDVLRPPDHPRSRPPEGHDARDELAHDAADARRLRLLRAIAELAETHAVAADLAYRQAAIDLALDVPDPVFHAFDHALDDSATPRDQQRGRERQSEPSLIVPDVIRTCRDRLEAYIGEPDRMRFDIVATLFDHVLADDGLPTEVRNTLARLQLPVLRMALADDSFFASRTHPTRRLLDRLAQSASTSESASVSASACPPGGDRKLDSESQRARRAEIERTVHAVIHGSSEDASHHARLLEAFEQRLVEIAAAVVPRLTLAPDQEDRDVLVIKATIQISQLLVGLDVDRAIRFFLLDVWSRVLGEIAFAHPANELRGAPLAMRDAARESSRDATLARAKRLCGDLAWSVAPKTTSGERARLAGLLPTMIEALRDGFSMIEYPKTEQDRFFADWARMLYVAVQRRQPGPRADGEINRAFRLAGIGAGAKPAEMPEALDIDDFARRLREGSFGPDLPRKDATRDRAAASNRSGLRVVEDATPSMLLARLPKKPASELSTAASTAASNAAPTASPTASPSEPAAVPLEIAELRKGAWFELRDELRNPGGFVEVRLSWISPLKSFYLFIGADSAITRSYDPESLAELIARGDLRLCTR